MSAKTVELQRLATNGAAAKAPAQEAGGRLKCTKCGKFPRAGGTTLQANGDLLHTAKSPAGECGGLVTLLEEPAPAAEPARKPRKPAYQVANEKRARRPRKPKTPPPGEGRTGCCRPVRGAAGHAGDSRQVGGALRRQPRVGHDAPGGR